uniref:Uncharacterized protein n=1 Tax=Anguilla anguilla TaxID=7936 RepID=A0A0E9R9N6_ANGAN
MHVQDILILNICAMYNISTRLIKTQKSAAVVWGWLV